MRIGEFSKKYAVPIDTIRHYMDLELLLPEKKGGHYHFKTIDGQDLMEILKFKKIDFSLAEIQKIFAYKRLAPMKTQEDYLHLRYLLEIKHKELLGKKEDLENTLHYLEKTIDEIYIPSAKSSQVLGLPLSFLPYLRCPKCSNILILNDGSIVHNMIISGSFQCECGYEAKVQQGIYMALDEEDKRKIIPLPEKSAPSIQKYVEGTPTKFIHFLYRGIDLIIQALMKNNIEGHTILELGTGSGFFLKHFLKHLPVNTFYILSDHDFKRLEKVKDYLEKESNHRNFIFLCTDFEKLPLTEGVIDDVVDNWGSVTYNINSPHFLPDVVDKWVKTEGKWFGVYAYCREPKFLQRIPQSHWSFYSQSYLEKRFRQSSFKELDKQELGSIDDGGEYEPLISGNTIYEFFWYGEK